MTSDLDVYRVAKQYIDLHGDLAKIQAARMADQMLEKGDTEGQRVWMRIRRAIADLTEGGPGPAH